MSYKIINIYDEDTGEITSQVLLPEKRVEDYLENNLLPGKRGLDMGVDTLHIAEGIEFSDKANPTAANVQHKNK